LHEVRLGEQLGVPEQQLACHAFICGATGSGKSRAMEHFLAHEMKVRHSVVLIDPKGETAERMFAAAVQHGIAPDRITVVDPRQLEYVPSWNPLTCGIPLAQAVNDLVALLAASTTSWGPRLQNLLVNALLVIGSHGLSLFELSRFLTLDDYREALLRQPPLFGEALAYSEACYYFQSEFGNWTRGERTQAVSPVLNKLAEFLRSPFLRPMLCARRNGLDFARLWQRQEVVIVRLDRAVLGDEGARLLGGILAHLLLRTAQREPGKLPVTLAIDELPQVERFVGAAVADVLAIARSLRLRVFVACQHLGQLSDGLREALLANAAAQLFFRLGHNDARLVATSLAAKCKARVERLVAQVDAYDDGVPECRSHWHDIMDHAGHSLRLTPEAWERFQAADPECNATPVERLEQLVASLGVRRCYVEAAGGDERVALRDYVRGLPAGEYEIDGPQLRLTVWFPRPRLTKVERLSEADFLRDWTVRLEDLARQHAILRAQGAAPCVVKLVNVADITLDPEIRAEALARAQRANGQSVAEIAGTLAWRDANVRRIAAGGGLPDEGKEADDGSIA